MHKMMEALYFSERESIALPMEYFVQGFESCPHELSFLAFADSLTKLSCEFDLIDKNADGVVTCDELREHANEHANCRSEVSFVVCHYDALAHASMVPSRKITRDSLDRASSVLRGMEYVRQHFNSIATNQHGRIYAEDLLRRVCNREGLCPDESSAIWHLIHYLLHLSKMKHARSGLSHNELAAVQPEDIWRTVTIN